MKENAGGRYGESNDIVISEIDIETDRSPVWVGRVCHPSQVPWDTHYPLSSQYALTTVNLHSV